MTDRRLWKHYLPATSLAGGNNHHINMSFLWRNKQNLFPEGAKQSLFPERNTPCCHDSMLLIAQQRTNQFLLSSYKCDDLLIGQHMKVKSSLLWAQRQKDYIFFYSSTNFMAFVYCMMIVPVTYSLLSRAKSDCLVPFYIKSVLQEQGSKSEGKSEHNF